MFKTKKPALNIITTLKRYCNAILNVFKKIYDQNFLDFIRDFSNLIENLLLIK